MYVKGEKYSELQGQDGVKIDYTSSGLTLFIRYVDITANEVRNFSKEPMKHELFWDGEVIYCLFKFGSARWMDAPFHKVLMLENANIPAFTNDEEKELLLVVVSDGRNGECKVLRAITLERKFSEEMHKLINLQKNDISTTEVYKQIEKTYRTYTTDRMLTHKIK